jgi:hypothetical protein
MQLNNLTDNSVDQQADQQAEQVYKTGRAQIIYPTDVAVDEEVSLLEDDDELDLTPANLSEGDDELPELDDLPEDPEEETDEEEFGEGSPRFEQFKNDFVKAFGLPMEEARDLVQGLREESTKRAINEQKYELSAAWNVPVTEVDRRLAVVAKVWSKLPADKQQAYDSTKGAQVLYARHEAQQTKTATTRSSQRTSTKATSNTPAKYWYTQPQIERMSAEEYSANADRIMVAYAQNKVKK